MSDEAADVTKEGNFNVLSLVRYYLSEGDYNRAVMLCALFQEDFPWLKELLRSHIKGEEQENPTTPIQVLIVISLRGYSTNRLDILFTEERIRNHCIDRFYAIAVLEGEYGWETENNFPVFENQYQIDCWVQSKSTQEILDAIMEHDSENYIHELHELSISFPLLRRMAESDVLDLS